MKAAKVLLIGVCCAFFCLAGGYQVDLAAARDNDKSLRIAVVNIRELFTESKKNSDYQAQASQQRNEIYAELEALSSEIDAAKAVLKTRKVGAGDYWDLRKELALKQGALEAKKELYQQQINQKDQQWTEQLYKQIIDAVGKVAEQQSFDIVLAKDEPELPVGASTLEFMLAIRTHKVLYASQQLDITKEVLALIDSNSN